ncbi:hypothetical protein [Streptomyces sp. NPDC056632]|uniref:hypothetical protein n=1 Tax=Streptomyces sp. NPDC056632 TaxID=3345884 RepID=UPI0036C336DB
MTLDQRNPGQALAAIVPAPQPPAEVNLFGASLGDSFERRFDPARLHLISSNPSPAGDNREVAS